MEKYFENLIKNRQSCRDFNEKEVSAETLEKIAELAMLAPSACNSQPWKMYLLSGEKSKSVIPALQERGHNPFLEKAKAFIVVTEKDATLKPSASARFNRNHFVKYDIGELLAYITLSAKSVGVESCIIGMVDQNLIGSAVGLSDGEVCNVAVALGYSDIPLRDKKRKPLEETIVKL
jgi:nitroreductase